MGIRIQTLQALGPVGITARKKITTRVAFSCRRNQKQQVEARPAGNAIGANGVATWRQSGSGIAGGRCNAVNGDGTPKRRPRVPE